MKDNKMITKKNIIIVSVILVIIVAIICAAFVLNKNNANKDNPITAEQSADEPKVTGTKNDIIASSGEATKTEVAEEPNETEEIVSDKKEDTKTDNKTDEVKDDKETTKGDPTKAVVSPSADKTTNTNDKTEKPVNNPVEQPTDKPAEQPAVKPVEQPADKPAEQPVVQPTHVHNWQTYEERTPIAEESHEEQREVSYAWTETIYEAHQTCNGCGWHETEKDGISAERAIGKHINSCEVYGYADVFGEKVLITPTYGSVMYEVGKIEHPAVYETVKVVDVPAGTLVTTYRKCSCGANENIGVYVE